MIELRLLKYFQAVVEEGTFSRAAKRLHITQPTLSRQIKDLEAFYNIKFFDRSSHPLSLTEEGLNLYHKSKQIIELSDKLEQDLINQDEFEGVIAIGAVESAGAEGVYKDLIEISKEYPKISFNLYHSDSDDIKEKLNKELLDIGILTEPVELNHFNYIKLPEEDQWCILVSKDNKLAHNKSLSWNDLVNEPLLISKRFSQNREFPEFFNSKESNFNILATYSLFSNAIFLVEENLAIAPGIKAVHSIKNNPKVKLIPLKPEIRTGSYLVWKKSQILNKPAQKFLDLLINKIQARIAQKA